MHGQQNIKKQLFMSESRSEKHPVCFAHLFVLMNPTSSIIFSEMFLSIPAPTYVLFQAQFFFSSAIIRYEYFNSSVIIFLSFSLSQFFSFSTSSRSFYIIRAICILNLSETKYFICLLGTFLASEWKPPGMQICTQQSTSRGG